MEATIELATNGYIIRYPDGEVYIFDYFDDILNELFGFLQDTLNYEIKLKIKLDYEPDDRTTNEC